MKVTYSQNIHFIKSYGNSGYDFGRDIKQDTDTGYVATGSSSSFTSGNADAFILKVDSLGNFKWSYNYGGQESDWGESIVVTFDSSYALAGYTNSYGAGGYDFYLVRANANGTPLWEKTYGGSDWDRAFDLIQLADSGFVLVGETYSYGNGNQDVYVVRTDKNGDTLWTRTYGGIQADYANAVILDGDSLVIVGGTESFGNGMTDGLILKYHIDGSLGSVQTVGLSGDDYFTSITKNSLSDYFIGGTKNYDHYLSCDCGYDFWIYRTNQLLNVIVDTSWTGDQYGEDYVNDLIINGNNDIFYGGSTTSWGSTDISSGISDAFINKLLNTYYTTGYIKNFGSNGSDYIQALDNCFDGGLVGIGVMDYNSSGGGNLFIIKNDQSDSFGGIDVSTDMTNENLTLSINDINEINSTISTYPTPFTNQLTITGLDNNNLIEIFNINGQLSHTFVNSDGTLYLNDLENGFYILKIFQNNRNYSIKIIKN